MLYYATAGHDLKFQFNTNYVDYTFFILYRMLICYAVLNHAIWIFLQAISKTNDEHKENGGCA